MKSFSLPPKCLAVTALMFFFLDAHAQLERVYASSQTEGGSVLTHTNTAVGQAVDSDPATASNLSITVIGNAWQILNFPGGSLPSTSTKVHIKLGSTESLLGITGITVQAYNDGFPVANTTQDISSLVSLIGGASQYEVIYAPNVTFDAVRIYMEGISLGGGLNIYEAYYYRTPASPVSCQAPVDELNGVSSGLISAINGVTDPSDAKDGNMNTYSTIHAAVSVANYVYQTILYPGVSETEDSVRIVFSVPSALLSVNSLASSLTIVTYNGTTQVEQITNNVSLLNIRLIDNGTSPSVIAFRPSGVFDRIQIRLGGLASVLSQVRIHEVQRITPDPVVSSPSVSTCSGSPASLEATGSGNSVLRWFTSLIGGTLQGTGSPFATSAISSPTTYYVESRRTGCTNSSDRKPVNIATLSLPGIVTSILPSALVGVPYSEQLTASDGLAPYTFSLLSGSLPAGLSLASNGVISGTPTNSAPVYNFVAEVEDANGCASSRAFAVTLPVRLKGFKAKELNGQVLLSWITASEENTDYFDVQRSADGEDYKSIGKVKAVGNTQMDQSYAYADLNPAGNPVHYRLMIVDRDGRYEYSSVLTVHMGNTAYVRPEFMVLPNPSKAKLIIHVKNVDIVEQVIVHDIQGRMIRSVKKPGTEPIGIYLPPGTYVVHALNRDGKTVQTEKAIVD